MKTIEDINLYTWHTEREVPYIPQHFVLVNTPLTEESRAWILEKLMGRYAVVSEPLSFLDPVASPKVAFEDPKEAVFYELTWS